MNRSLWVAFPLLLTLVTSGSCFQDDAAITCDNFARFQANCTANCTVTWDCESYYDTLDIDTQIDLDECSDCLANNLDAEVCADCSVPGVSSCQDFMEDLLGSDCW